MAYARRHTEDDATWSRAWTADTPADLVLIAAIKGNERPHHGDVAYVTSEGKYYLWMDNDTWIKIETGGGSGLTLHHATHEAGGTDVVTLAQSQITGLSTSLAGKADKPVPTTDGGTGVTTGLTVLNGSNITSGTIADTRLSSNVVLTTDPRLTDSRTPTAHATTHEVGGSDIIDQLAPQIEDLTVRKPIARLVLQHTGSGGTTKGRVAAVINDWVGMHLNATYNGTSWDKDDISKDSMFVSAVTNSVSIAGWPAAGAIGDIFNVSVGGIVNFLKGQLKFPTTQNPSTDAYTLDDYREIPWTPIISASTSYSGQVYSQQNGIAIKIGRVVLIAGNVNLSTKGSMSGSISIGNLPFTVSGQFGYLGIGYILNLNSSWSTVVGVPTNPAVAQLYGIKTPSTGFITVDSSDITSTSMFYFGGFYFSTA